MLYKDKIHDDVHYQNRLSLIQLLLIVFSSPLYKSLKENEKFIDPLLWLFSSQWNKNIKEIFYSLLNFAFNHELGRFVSFI